MKLLAGPVERGVSGHHSLVELSRCRRYASIMALERHRASTSSFSVASRRAPPVLPRWRPCRSGSLLQSCLQRGVSDSVNTKSCACGLPTTELRRECLPNLVEMHELVVRDSGLPPIGSGAVKPVIGSVARWELTNSARLFFLSIRSRFESAMTFPSLSVTECPRAS